MKEAPAHHAFLNDDVIVARTVAAIFARVVAADEGESPAFISPLPSSCGAFLQMCMFGWGFTGRFE